MRLDGHRQTCSTDDELFARRVVNAASSRAKNRYYTVKRHCPASARPRCGRPALPDVSASTIHPYMLSEFS